MLKYENARVKFFHINHKVQYIYTKNTKVSVPSCELGTPPPTPSPASKCALPPELN
jgi:hypothetical protein